MKNCSQDEISSLLMFEKAPNESLNSELVFVICYASSFFHVNCHHREGNEK